MGSNAEPVDIMDSSDDEFQALESMNVGVPDGRKYIDDLFL